MEHFAINLLSEYGTEKIPETKRPVVNPARRVLDQRRRSLQSRLQQRQARYGAMTLHPENEPAEMVQWLKGGFQSQSQRVEADLAMRTSRGVR